MTYIIINILNVATYIIITILNIATYIIITILNIATYLIIRTDRLAKRGGGAVNLVSCEHKCHEIIPPEMYASFE